MRLLDRGSVLTGIYSDQHKWDFLCGSDIDHAEDFLYGKSMNRAEIMSSSSLKTERLRLQQLEDTIRSGGRVAPAKCWLTESHETKNSKTYTYIRLVTEKENGKITSPSLGRPGSSRHREWQAAIARRDALNEIALQGAMLDELIQRQEKKRELIDKALYLECIELGSVSNGTRK
jgi:hypothetical protein